MLGFERTWNDHYPGLRPRGHELRAALGHRWLRIHSLPESKRYPETAEHWEELLRRQQRVAADILGDGAPVWVVVPSHELDEDGHLPELPSLSLEVAPSLDPPADPPADPPPDPDVLPVRFHFARTRWDAAAMEPLLRAIADDARRAVFVSPTHARVFAPYDGGVDIVVENVAARDRARALYRAWLSTRADGL